MMEQAQKAVEISTLERFLSFAYNVISQYPDAGLKLDPEQIIDIAAKNMGISPKVIRSDEKIEEIKKKIQAQQQAAAAAQAQQQSLDAAEQLSRTQVGEGNAIDALLETARAGDVAGLV